MKKLVCFLIGHDIDPCDCYASECFRCGLVFDWESPPRSDIGFWLDWYALKRRLRGIRDNRSPDDSIPF